MLITISRKKKINIKAGWGESVYWKPPDFPLKFASNFIALNDKVYYLKFLNKNTTKIKAARCQISPICHHFKILFQLWLWWLIWQNGDKNIWQTYIKNPINVNNFWLGNFTYRNSLSGNNQINAQIYVCVCTSVCVHEYTREVTWIWCLLTALLKVAKIWK